MQIRSFPILLQVLEREYGPANEQGTPPTDIYWGDYCQGAAPSDDFVQWGAPLAHHREVEETDPCFRGSEPAYMRGARLQPATPTLPGARRPCYSPDARRLAYLQDDDAVWLADANGRHPLLVAQTEVADVHFGPDGRLWYSRGARGLVARAADGEETRVATGREAGEFALSHDGRSLAYLDPSAGVLLCHDLATGRERVLAETDDWALSPVFTPDDSRILFAVTQVEMEDPDVARTRCQLYAVPSDGSARVTLVGDGLNVQRLAVPG